jgi:hypothetical protein
MLSTPMRALCAFAAVVAFYGGIAGLVVSPNALYVLALFAAAVLVMPAMFGGAKPTESDLPRIEEQLHRFRSAMLICFAATAGVYAFVITSRGRTRTAVLQQLSSLGVALWLVAFVLMFFVAYYATQRRTAERRIEQ